MMFDEKNPMEPDINPSINEETNSYMERSSENTATPELESVTMRTGTNPVDELPEIPAPADAAAPVPEVSGRRSGSKNGSWKMFAAAVALVAIGAGVGSATTYTLASKFGKSSTPIGWTEATPSAKSAKTVAASPITAGPDNVIPEIYRRVSPSVVEIDVKVSGRFTRGTQSGSGFVVDPKGYILTNNHVVEGGSKFTVNFVDGTSLDAKLVGTDKYKDLAVLKVDPGSHSLVPAVLGDSDTVQIGELAVAIGSPFGQNHSVTSGIVSGLNREIQEDTNSVTIPGAIQTDAAINPGNSGGPLLNASGEVIGINTAIESPTRGSVGIGFAIPINAAKAILPTLLAGQNVQYPWMGVRLTDMTKEYAQQLDSTQTTGALILQVYQNSPAAKAGLKNPRIDINGDFYTADIVTAVDGKAIKTAQELTTLVQSHKVGDTLSLTVVRGNQTVNLKVTLDAKPDPADLANQDQ